MKIKAEKDLIKHVINTYRDARRTKFANNKIFRGRSHSISSIIEDLFAHYLTQNIECDQIYIDQPLKIEGIKGRNIYPDLVIIKDDKIIALLDLKMDLGWKRRELFNLAKKYSNLIKNIRNKKVSLKIGETKERRDFKVSNKITYDIVIISDTNINKELLEKQLKQIEKLKPKIDVFILTKGKHPNSYNLPIQSLLSQIIVNKADFDRMFRKLKAKKYF